jgi:hypothetical protein
VRFWIGSEKDSPTEPSGNWFSEIVPYDRPVAPSSGGGMTIGPPLKFSASGLAEPARPRRW